jgi:hypothetical protein
MDFSIRWALSHDNTKYPFHHSGCGLNVNKKELIKKKIQGFWKRIYKCRWDIRIT